MTNSFTYRPFSRWTWATLLCSMLLGTYPIQAEPGIRIDGKTLSVEELTKDNPGRFFSLEQKKYELIHAIAQEKYLQHYFPTEKARNEFLEGKAKVSDKDVKEALARFKDHPALKDKPEAERQKAVADYLKQTKKQEALSQILQEAEEKKRLVVLYPEPQEPIYPVTVQSQEPTRFGPIGKEKQTGCQGDDCAITVVEYSDFECPFCERAQSPTQEVLKAYQGKIRWIVRDFPLDMHPRSRPAAVAAHCAKEQGKYWEMYNALFQSSNQLGDADLRRMADRIGLDGKAYESCVRKPETITAAINSNLKSGEQLGVTGTPTYFVNGRRVSGALPFEAFKRVIEQSLARK